MVNVKSSTLWSLLAALALVTRLPYFFIDVIDWDESTFILMGDSLLKGFLPYTHIWDNKPPAIFFLFAALIGFGDDVLVTRIFGAVLVVATAWFVYALATRIHSRQAGVFGALVYVLGMSATASGQATTSELISTLPVLAALWLLIERRNGVGWYVLSGALLSLATLIRLNLALVVIAFALLIPIYERERGIAQCLRAMFAYGVGGIAVLLAFMAPYAVSGSFPLFWYSVFEAPFLYATTQSGPLANFVQHAFNAMGVRLGFDGPQFAVGVAAWVVGAAGILLAIRSVHGSQDRERRLTLVGTLGVMVATGLSIVVSGVAPMHYLIGLLPFMTLFAGVAYAYLAERGLAPASWALLGVCGLVMLAPVASEYRDTWQRVAGGSRLMHGPSYDIAAYLHEPCAGGCNVYLLEDHLAYTMLDADPPRKIVTHPSNISKPSLLNAEIGAEPTPEGEMRAVLATHPDFIVKRPRVWYLQPAQERILEQTLQQDYRLVHEVDGRQIYQAIEP
ncbi:MAG: glycosyltransferase family 39 protein [Pseudomonadota bacterium]|nr:glycosyltransferase family 39 protein [Pseudomonadota bacterium]